MPVRARGLVAVSLIVVALLAGGCEEQSFTEPTKIRETFMDIDDVLVDGQRRLEFRVDVPAGVTHPSFEGLWTFRNPEKPLHLFVVRASEYDPLVDPNTLPNYFQIRRTDNFLNIHPTSGEQWVVVLHNPADFGPLTRSEVSGTATLSYWR
jgi:hypothetical protein